jgi:4-diphosphocytidyl-2-C-methyl-D-erythritol kinase
MTRARAFAKINLALVVGALRADGRHEVATVLQRIDLHDVVELEPAPETGILIEGFEEDTLVRRALGALADATGSSPRWHVRIEKHIPVAAGLGGGSADAAAALMLANEQSPEPFSAHELAALAASIGADVPFFLSRGSQLATGYGTELSSLALPEDYVVLLALPRDEHKVSTADVYLAFDERAGADGYGERRAELLAALARIERPQDLAALPRNDLASSPLADELAQLGAFRADVSGAGPVVYGLFERERDASRACEQLGGAERTWLVRPVSAL